LSQALQVFLAQFTLEQPVADRLVDDIACGGVFAGFDGGFECSDLLAGQGNTDFLNVGHETSPVSLEQILLLSARAPSASRGELSPDNAHDVPEGRSLLE
jgi:hypothetical protein